MHRRSAITRIELLVGLLIAVLLVGCFLAAMFRIRAEADMMNCSNNLKQLGLALHNYHDTENTLPLLTGQDDESGPVLPSVFAFLTPYIESDPWNYHRNRTPADYHSDSSVPFPWKNKDGTPGGVDYGGIANQFRSVFIDPGDEVANRRRDVPMALPDGTTGYYATCSYAANGLLPWGVQRPRDSFPGELSNTILFAERPQVCITQAGETIYNLWGVGFYSPHMPAFATLTPIEPPGLWSTNQIAPVLPLPDAEGIVPIRIGRQGAPADEATSIVTPIQHVRCGRPCDPRLPGTPHSRGMQVAMCDGSVRVFATETNAWVFWKACVP